VIWNDEADALLVKLFDEGLSLGQCAKGMTEAGYIVSRNAVAGRRHRLMPEAFKRKVTSTRIIKSTPRPRQRSKPVENKPARKSVTISDIDALADNEGIEYLDLNPWQCKAIMEGPKSGPWMLHKVCGLPRCEGSPYCRGHLKLYTNPIPAQRRA
jgi:hypothetical protein